MTGSSTTASKFLQEVELHTSSAATTPRLFVLTGAIGEGKTTWCGQVIRLAQTRELRVAGLLSPARFVNGHKIGIDLVDLSTNQQRQLAQRRGDEAGPIATTGWDFDPQVIAWGNRVLDSLPPNDLLVIDELGPLEFNRGEGLLAGLRILDAMAYQVALVVIRPWLLPEVQARWPIAEVISPQR